MLFCSEVASRRDGPVAAFINSFKLLTTKQMALLCVPFAYTGKKIFSRLRTSAEFLPSAIEVCEGYVFTPVCHSVHRGGVQAKAQGGLLRGVSRPRPSGGRVSRPRPRGVCIAACTEANTPPPPSRRLLLRTVRILLECILVLNCMYIH